MTDEPETKNITNQVETKPTDDNPKPKEKTTVRSLIPTKDKITPSWQS